MFCAGADLKERREHPGKDAEFRAPLLQFWQELAQFAKPLVIAVNGHAAGGGFELSLLGDAVIASESAQFWLPEVQWGGIPGGWGTQLLPRLVGPLRARWIIFNGHRISAREMLGMGLVTHVVPQAEVLDTARAIAKELATRPPTAVAMAKEAIRQALNVPLAQRHRIEEKLLQQAVAAPERGAYARTFCAGSPAEITTMAAPTSAPGHDPVVSAFADWSRTLRWDSLSEKTRKAVKYELLDYLGCLMAGRALMGRPGWVAELADRGGRADAAIVGGPQLPAPIAALANGYYGHVLEYDDTHDEAVLHAGAAAIPAALAAAEYRRMQDPKQFLEAVLLGIEVTCRLGVATSSISSTAAGSTRRCWDTSVRRQPQRIC